MPLQWRRVISWTAGTFLNTENLKKKTSVALKKKFLRAGFEPATYGLLTLYNQLQSTALPTELPEELANILIDTVQITLWLCDLITGACTRVFSQRRT